MANNNRAVNATLDQAFLQRVDQIKALVNGVLEHEISVGDAAYIKHENKLAVPFTPELQYKYTLVHSGSVSSAAYLTVARMGLLAYWRDELNSADNEEIFKADIFAKSYTALKANGVTTVTSDKDPAFKDVAFATPKSFPDSDWSLDLNDLDNLAPINGVNLKILFLHMKDIGMLVSSNLVKTGHHYQKTTNGAFKAIERKRYGDAVFSEELRGIIYHEAMHCFTQIAKMSIYARFMANYKANSLQGSFLLLDTVVTKRLPVVPAGAAWLSAGITVMNELLAIPNIGTRIPVDYSTLVGDARAALTECINVGKSSAVDLSRFEALAAFAFGVLTEIAPSHSAAKAPSLSKMATQHLGAATAGNDLGRKALRGEI